MQLKSNKLFPYPMLWEERDDYKNKSAFKMNVAYEIVGPKVNFSLDVIIENDAILNLLDQYIQIVCHIECAKTKYRDSFVLKKGNNDLSLPANTLNGKIEIVSVLQTIKDLNNYSNIDFNASISKIVFDIPAYNIIGISSHYNVYIDKENDNLSEVSSIISVIPNSDNSKYMSVSCESKSKIYVKLPQKSYLHYSTISKNDTYNDVIFSLVVIPALVMTFEYLIVQEDLEAFEDYRWYRGLCKKFKEVMKIDLSLEYLSKADLLEISQRILGSPINGAFDKITSSKGDK